MGVTVREKKKGRGEWWVFIKHNGRRKSKKIGDKRTAKEVAKKIEARLVLGDLELDGKAEESGKGVPAFQKYAQLWLDGYIKKTKKHQTYVRYQGLLVRFILPEIGEKPLDSITRGELRNLLLKFSDMGMSGSSVGLIRGVLSGVFSMALDDEIITANPTGELTKKLNIKKRQREQIDPLNFAEVNLFLETCREHYPEMYPLFLTAFRTGMRLGEILGLQWGDIDWNERFIKVQRSYNKRDLTTTKTGNTRRVDMSNQLAEALKKLRVIRKKEFLQTGQRVDFVFHRNSIPIAQNSVRNCLTRILEKSGIRHVRFHDIRHTFASLLLTNGETPVYVKEQMGHTTIQTTVDIYGHLIPSSNREAVDRLDQAPKGTPWTPQEKKKTVNG